MSNNTNKSNKGEKPENTSHKSTENPMDTVKTSAIPKRVQTYTQDKENDKNHSE